MKINELTTAAINVRYTLLHKILVENKSKAKAIRETLIYLDVCVPVLAIALKEVDTYICNKYGDDAYHMVCLNQKQWLVNKVTLPSLIDEGFKIRKDLNDDTVYNIYVDGCVTAKLFKSETNAIAFLYKSAFVPPLPVNFEGVEKLHG